MIASAPIQPLQMKRALVLLVLSVSTASLSDEIPSCFDSDFSRDALAKRSATYSLSDFQAAFLGSNWSESIRKIGTPGYHCGSGIPYEVYFLDDARELWVAYDNYDNRWGFVVEPTTKKRTSVL